MCHPLLLTEGKQYITCLDNNLFVVHPPETIQEGEKVQNLKDIVQCCLGDVRELDGESQSLGNAAMDHFGGSQGTERMNSIIREQRV